MKRIPRSHPLHNFYIAVALATLVAAQTCLAFDPNEWRNAGARSSTQGLLRVNVPAETLDAAQPRLEDRVAFLAETTITMTAMFQND